ncbi:MAG: STAS domain-containing protein [Candidatus Solibacter usitatus]|nr:STAS domain-containing protein [Candidatus Solibacter usitatus]
MRNSDAAGISVLALEGFLDAHTAPQFEEAIQKEVAAGRRNIAVDCAQLTYISSAGLGVFMSFIEEIRDAGGDIKICAVIPKVLQVFEILGFQSLFDIVADVPAAQAKFAAGPREG